MQILPAIDLRAGKCVRLRQGDYDQETVFGDDPVAMARRWVEQGAERLHLVDLDGARKGRLHNREVVAQIVAAVQVPCQLGGGIRDEGTIRELFEMGVDRLVVGTRALKDPEWFRGMCRIFPGMLALGIDARDGKVATDGWLETSQTDAVEMAGWYSREPLAAIVYTDIAQDGMMAGPNIAETRKMAGAVSVPVIASGGVTTLEDVSQLAQADVDGCIIGRALYEGALTVSEAISAASR